MELPHDEFSDILSSAWQLVLEQALEFAGTVDEQAGQYLQACVHLTGDWSGTLTLAVSEEYAEVLARTLFGLEGDASADDVRDALGEMANIVGGNLKGLLPCPVELSLPLVARGELGLLAHPGAERIESSAWFAGDHQVLVSVHEQGAAH